MRNRRNDQLRVQRGRAAPARPRAPGRNAPAPGPAPGPSTSSGGVCRRSRVTAGATRPPHPGLAKQHAEPFRPRRSARLCGSRGMTPWPNNCSVAAPAAGRSPASGARSRVASPRTSGIERLQPGRLLPQVIQPAAPADPAGGWSRCPLPMARRSRSASGRASAHTPAWPCGPIAAVLPGAATRRRPAAARDPRRRSARPPPRATARSRFPRRPSRPRCHPPRFRPASHGRIDQGQHLAASIDGGHRAELPGPGCIPDQPGQLLRHQQASPAGGPPDLPPEVSPPRPRTVQVPGPGRRCRRGTPEGDPVADQPAGHRCRSSQPAAPAPGPRRGRYPRQASQARQGETGPSLILSFGFLHGTRRRPLPDGRRSTQSPVVFGLLLLGTRLCTVRE